MPASDQHNPSSTPSFLLSSLKSKMGSSDRCFDHLTWVLPTSRLATLFNYELAQKFGALVPPKILTWGAFLEELCAKTGVLVNAHLQTATAAKANWELRKLLSQEDTLWAKAGIGRSFEREILGLWRDLQLSSGGLDALLHLKERLSEFSMFHDEAETLLAKRLEGVYALLAETESTLTRQGWASEFLQQRNKTRELCLQLKAMDQEPFHPSAGCYFYGLKSLPLIGHELLQVLSECNGIFIDISCEQVKASANHSKDAPAPFFCSLSKSEARYWQAADPLQECEAAIFSVCRTLEQNADIAPKDLCIAVMDEKRFGDPLFELAEKHLSPKGIPFNHAIGSLQALSPCFRYLQGRRKQIRKQLLDQNPLQQTWAELLREIPKEIDSRPLLQGLNELDPSLSQGQVHESIADVLQILGEQQAHPSGQALKGVQILRFSEVRFLKFHQVIVLGAHAQTLPSKSKPLTLLSHGLRGLMNLPTPQQKLGLELSNLQSLVDNCSSVDFYLSARSGDQEQYPSPVLQRLCGEVQAVSHQVGTSILADEPRASIPKWSPPKAGARAEIADGITPSKADQLLRCPGRYYLLQKNIAPWEELTDHLDARDEGKFAHKVLEDTLKGSAVIRPLWAAWLREQADTNKQALVLALTQKATKQLYSELRNTQVRLSRVFTLQLEHHSIPRWAGFVTELACLAKAPDFWQNIATEKSWQAKLGQEQFRGIYDLKAQVGASTVLVDYKRTSRTPVSKVNQGLAVQLPLYGLSLQNADKQEEQRDNILIGYWDILAGEWRPMNAIPKNLESPLKESDLHKSRSRNSLTELLGAAQEQLETIFAEIESKGHFFLRSNDCEYCEFKPICRIEQNALFQASTEASI